MNPSETIPTNGSETRIDRIVAAVDDAPAPLPAEILTRLAAAEEKLATLARENAELKAARSVNFSAPAATTTTASISAAESLRKTLPPSMCALLAKAGMDGAAGKDAGGSAALDSGALDQALSSLSVEQRIAVKAEMARAGLIA